MMWLALRACWPYIACAALGFGAAWYIQGNTYGAKIARTALQAEQDRTEAVGEAYRLTNKWQGTKDDAIRKAETRARTLAGITAGARADVDRLRGNLADVPGRIANASRAAVDQYATAANRVFLQCVREYQALAERADGHANDVHTLSDSWPR